MIIIRFLLVFVLCLEIKGSESISKWWSGSDSVEKHSKGVGPALLHHDSKDPSPLTPVINKEIGYDIYNRAHKNAVRDNPSQERNYNAALNQAAREVFSEYHRFPNRLSRSISDSVVSGRDAVRDTVIPVATGYSLAKAESSALCPCCNIL
jgi:hypothetical protein